MHPSLTPPPRPRFIFLSFSIVFFLLFSESPPLVSSHFFFSLPLSPPLSPCNKNNDDANNHEKKIHTRRSVGSPHRPPPPGSPIPDQTRGILTWCEREAPGSFHAGEHGVRYTTVGSRFVKGAPLFGSGSGGDGGSALEEEEQEESRRRRTMRGAAGGGSGGGSASADSLDSDDSDIALLFAPDPDGASGSNSSRNRISIAQRLAGLGYGAVCGDAEAWGDGITPVASSHLPGAATLTLEGVFHSPLGATDDGAGEDGGRGGERPWYGSAGVLDQWVGAVFGEAPLASATVDVTEERAV